MNWQSSFHFYAKGIERNKEGGVLMYDVQKPMSQGIFDTILLPDITDRLHNCIWMHTDKINGFFTKETPQQNRYVIIANKIFRVGEKNFIDLSQIGMSKRQMKSLGLKASISSKVVASQCIIDTVCPIPRLMFYLSSPSNVCSKNTMIHLEKLRQEVLVKMLGSVIQKDQCLELDLPSLGFRKLEVHDGDSKFDDGKSNSSINKKLGIGKISEKTRIDFFIKSKECIVEKILPAHPSRSFAFGIAFQEKPSLKSLEGGPIQVDHKELEKLLRQKLIGKDLASGFGVKYKQDDGDAHRRRPYFLFFRR